MRASFTVNLRAPWSTSDAGAVMRALRAGCRAITGRMGAAGPHPRVAHGDQSTGDLHPYTRYSKTDGII